ncbi:MAG: DUF1015 domain-containing protein [Nanoarchaeota archaeon]|nr:DUF1015 domain-containing protein [Nanoarchaeota archaeon]
MGNLNNSSKNSSKTALHVPEILLPNPENKDIDLKYWSVIACDQYTSDKAYWEKIEKMTANKLSAMHLIIPEAFLSKSDEDSINREIDEKNSKMQSYLDKGILKSEGNCFVMVDRKTPYEKSRKGLVVALDLEEFELTDNVERTESKSLIRASEGIIKERLPARIKLREKAALEMPHIIVLIDDPKKTVIEPLFKQTPDLEKLYDFKLMEKSGRLKGYKISKKQIIGKIEKSLAALKQKNGFIYAIGDGNHSFAAAKMHWEMLKSNGAEMNHPARYLLVELMNIHDSGIKFYPIHRVVFNTELKELLDKMDVFFKKKGTKIILDEKNPKGQKITILSGKKRLSLSLKNSEFIIESFQNFLDSFSDKDIDYIHEEKKVRELAKKGNIGFLLPPIKKAEFFKIIRKQGMLPKKSFSIGHSDEKRFYLECRKIR